MADKPYDLAIDKEEYNMMNEKKRFSQSVSTLWMTGLLLIFAPFLRVAQAQDLPPEVLRYADMVLYNGHVLTMDPGSTPFQRHPGRGSSRRSCPGGRRR